MPLPASRILADMLLIAGVATDTVVKVLLGTSIVVAVAMIILGALHVWGALHSACNCLLNLLLALCMMHNHHASVGKTALHTFVRIRCNRLRECSC